MNTTSLGRYAEEATADYLERQGFVVIDRNWRIRYCEIDIVAQKDRTVFFIEVKYRKNMRHGSGLEYITAQKMQKMQFAAELWVARHDWYGLYRLGAVEVAGQDYSITRAVLL